MTPNEGYSAGIAKRTSKDRLAWALKGAPLRNKSLKLSAIGALSEGRKLRDSISDKMMRAEINPEEAIVSVVFAKPDLSALIPVFPSVPVVPSAKDELEAAAANAESVPVGFLIFIWDKGEQKIFGHARPLLIDSRSLELNEQAVRVFDKYLRRVVLGEGIN